MRGQLTRPTSERAARRGFAQLVESAGGVSRCASAEAFGVGASLLALLSAQEGKLVAMPQGFPFAGLARITIFSDPHLAVQAIGLSSQPSPGGDAGYLLTLRARLL